jgi:hypothetical protein
VAERIKLYTDEHVPRAVVRGLRERGVDTLTVSEAGMLGAGDEEHLALARRVEQVLFTQVDISLRLHTSGVEHAGSFFNPSGARAGAGEGRMTLCMLYFFGDPVQSNRGYEDSICLFELRVPGAEVAGALS